MNRIQAVSIASVVLMWNSPLGAQAQNEEVVAQPPPAASGNAMATFGSGPVITQTLFPYASYTGEINLTGVLRAIPIFTLGKIKVYPPIEHRFHVTQALEDEGTPHAFCGLAEVKTLHHNQACGCRLIVFKIGDVVKWGIALETDATVNGYCRCQAFCVAP